MNCLLCQTKSCKTEGKDCNNGKKNSLNIYSNEETKSVYEHADKLVLNGRAGSLSRLEEIAEFSIEENYSSVGIAYCYAVEDLAHKCMNYLISRGISVRSYRCTINGVLECEISDKMKGKNVNCNPAGQAEAINKENVPFVIEMGLCLGHDVLFHKYLEKPFTVLLVKDRTNNHNPLLGIEEKS